MSTPDYYKILEVDPKATQQQIRDAYKKAALKHHPDRVPATSPERPRRTKKFQQINDAYYTLSDPTRRRDYDATRTYSFPSGFGGGSSSSGPGSFPSEDEDEEIPRQQTGGGGFGGFPWSTFGSAFGFGGGGNNNNRADESTNARANDQFGSIFEEMLREQGMAEGPDAHPTGKFWSLVGGLSGGAMGFIMANFPGMVAGAVAGNRLGAVRDTRGKSVYSVFSELPQAEKARLLSELAAKVFAHTVGS
ncbi:DnaJ-domain-containing protein [Delitschia confertaspora ATCC 74209]|uniref:DnaJ-domain-containing protein n=1 Tax=Delitschia confertaspora ATCC 74209 TaxID=1513339 RepID=A0A9P4JF41_9PLEO|nr:DnaJ-domain-containing protein [Delitschia confertaspora ATCC 74209]